ncbi:PilZ domain-containing protein [Croceicoccus bisphenolivorans]|uniref:PilZ domain-containing protein n=1 Tax=Croceicoccus bisphenolivorans TaxID=1783232 RepID=UPI0009EDF2F5|nr:PilZ domain-containing protein [Croceicoccus bisphenolivorans]
MAMAQVQDQRRADRVPVRLVTSHDGGNYPLTLLNLSTTGMLLSSPRSLRVGDKVQVELPEIGSTTAQVMWSDTDEYGCQFMQPIPESVVFAAEAASRRNRSHPSRQPEARRRMVMEHHGRNDETRALVLLIVFLAVTVVLFYAAQAIFTN